MRKTISHARLYRNASLDGDNRYMDGRREWEDIRDSREIIDLFGYRYINIYIYIYIYILSF